MRHSICGELYSITPSSETGRYRVNDADAQMDFDFAGESRKNYKTFINER